MDEIFASSQIYCTYCTGISHLSDHEHINQANAVSLWSTCPRTRISWYISHNVAALCNMPQAVARTIHVKHTVHALGNPSLSSCNQQIKVNRPMKELNLSCKNSFALRPPCQTRLTARLWRSWRRILQCTCMWFVNGGWKDSVLCNIAFAAFMALSQRTGVTGNKLHECNGTKIMGENDFVIYREFRTETLPVAILRQCAGGPSVR